jgi:hypothetical protein
MLDSSAAEAAFGLQPTPWERVLAETIAFYRGRLGAAAPAVG